MNIIFFLFLSLFISIKFHLGLCFFKINLLLNFKYFFFVIIIFLEIFYSIFVSWDYIIALFYILIYFLFITSNYCLFILLIWKITLRFYSYSSFFVFKKNITRVNCATFLHILWCKSSFILFWFYTFKIFRI